MPLIYFLGFFIGLIYVRARAGLGQGRIKIIGEGGVGLEWFVGSLLTLMFWPVSFVVWLARGRPEARIVFNDKARERRRRAAGM
ncbi:hypothetical protein [Micromonospora hortensis]|uniref:hypothetical protein n=1 Tax=Micromonospora hortensis TaxID=2911209 RepID=UPI001EE814C0|nr:hypothetical protein [Micromonospora hortensis]MCG5451833.1 hypothetical protein [Micromonospora hortensis]